MVVSIYAATIRAHFVFLHEQAVTRAELDIFEEGLDPSSAGRHLRFHSVSKSFRDGARIADHRVARAVR
jgi:hypothetical protein